VTDDGQTISSTRVRSALVSGDVEAAARLLATCTSWTAPGSMATVWVEAWVPTANVGVEPGKCLPEMGIYTTWIRARGDWLPPPRASATGPPSAGSPHRRGPRARLRGGPYGERVRLAFVHRLREERWYPDEAALIAQMQLDVAETRRLLEGAATPTAL